ncbi:ammonium transporter [Xylella taiwanensis]|nr:ammonium transporter [Xylella taiwanensis]MCD8456605.1 ammonium transporter [Xylella taiwanensis]MCD8459012.1 ammonium transporter [Xylella taiwanensis]MCD8461151.1 ammonium transporter [Xylella taiwanensis]MCD8462790.1 ammonium transporter [Xylella taiwanensis]MCD8465656.1 ammonium transporter [Xylella taiwanensis]
MKNGLFTMWKNRFYTTCILMAFTLLVGVNSIDNLQAQVQTNPLPSEQVTTELLTPQVASAEAVATSKTTPIPVVDKGDVAWMLTSTLLVLLMAVPGLALFYGGMLRSKNVLSMMIQIGVVFSLIAILWVLYGYSLAFADGDMFIGTLNKALLHDVDTATLADTFSKSFKLPEYVFIAFQLTFAGITGALIIGAFAERVKFAAVLLFIVIWFTFGYLPLAHMVWSAPGFLFNKGALDFAGGTVVHINAGIAGLVGAYFVGKRIGFGQIAVKPHNVPMTFTGAALLWVGWFGFNAGSALEANTIAALAFLNTMLATAAAVLVWSLLEKMIKGKSSALGVASGMVAGLVGVTPAAGTVGPFGAITIGAVAAVFCVWGVIGLKKLLNVDDTLDVFSVHGIGGIVGAILTGVFTDKALGGQGYSEGMTMSNQVMIQAMGVGISIVWIGIVSFVGFLIVKLVFGLRVPEEAEREGLDITSHGESAYDS